MAIPKVCGIETEYGILARGTDSNPVAASSLLINAYVNAVQRKVGWDFDDEQPGNDARGFSLDVAYPPEVETHLVNTVLTNGARYYVDHAHPEISTPECLDALEIVRFDRAAEEIVQRSMAAASLLLRGGDAELVRPQEQLRRQGQQLRLPRELPARPGRALRTRSSTRSPRTSSPARCSAGPARSAARSPGVTTDEVPYQLSQRADFFEEEVGLETTLKRPIVNTRDEPHCDPTKYRRLHVIVGDANMSEVATYLKVGTTSIVLAMIEDDVLGHDLLLANPVPSIRQISHDPTLTRTIPLRSGRRVTALEIQWSPARGSAEVRAVPRARRGRRSGRGRHPAALGDRAHRARERPRRRLAIGSTGSPRNGWSTGYRERHGLTVSDPALKAIDLQYHDMRPGKCLADRCRARTADPRSIVVDQAMTDPPTTTRAYFRGRCLQKWPDQIVAANWDSMVFDIGRDPLRRVPMMEPLRGTAPMWVA